MPAKSYKADGTAKKRWSSTERMARGHGPRHSGGKPRGRTTTPDKPNRDRREPKAAVKSWTPRDERPARTPRPATTPRAATAPRPAAADFGALGVPSGLVDQLAQAGIDTPFPIQTATIPDALNGRDVLGRAQTGSGKTLAFGLPMITTLSADRSEPARPPRGLILVPTRELAMQVADVLAPLARTQHLSVVLVAGGMSYTPQLRALQRSVDIVIATPGRLIDLLEQGGRPRSCRGRPSIPTQPCTL